MVIVIVMIVVVLIITMTVIMVILFMVLIIVMVMVVIVALLTAMLIIMVLIVMVMGTIPIPNGLRLASSRGDQGSLQLAGNALINLAQRWSKSAQDRDHNNNANRQNDHVFNKRLSPGGSAKESPHENESFL